MFKRMILCVTAATPEDVVKISMKICSKDTQVHALHVVRLLNDFSRKEALERFYWVTRSFEKKGLNCQLEILESTNAGKAITAFAKKKSCDVIVTGTIPKKGLIGAFSESVSDHIVKYAPCTVILIRKSDLKL